MPPRLAVALGLFGVVLTAFVLRAVYVAQQSAYMDEASMILTGRTLLEQRQVYADALDWTYGSYLWPLLAGAADIAGGLSLVRILAAGLGTVMALATTLAALRLAPREERTAPRWTVALLAGLIMAVFPTAIGVGRFGSYDPLAGAAFMGGFAVLLTARHSGARLTCLAAAALFFVAFLAKYVVAIYFPFICLYLLLAPRQRSVWVRNVVWFVLPLSVACALYFVTFRDALLALLAFSTSYTDLTSSHPLREYVWLRPELWLLAGLAVAGARRASRTERLVGFGGAGIIMGFQMLGRADFDFWKHSIYVIFFLAPLAARALTPVAEFLVRSALAAFRWRRATGTERVVALGGTLAILALQVRTWPALPSAHPALLVLLCLVLLAGLAFAPLAASLLASESRAMLPSDTRRTVTVALSVGAMLPLLIMPALADSNRLTTFYPNLNPSMDAIRQHTAGARRVLTDDSALRYHLYGQLPYQRITDPFFVTYRGEQDMAGYRRAIGDRYFDTIVLDGGIGPLGRRIRSELGTLIAQYYDRVYSREDKHGAPVEIYRAREDAPDPVAEPDTGGASVSYFDDGVQGWGAHPDNGELQPGFQVAVSTDRTWNGHPSLQFTAAEHASLVGVRVAGSVSTVRFRLYIVPAEGEGPEVRVGMVGFDENWQWHDDGFTQTVSTGRWNVITWQVPQPGVYHEIGLKLPGDRRTTVYLGRVDIQP